MSCGGGVLLVGRASEERGKTRRGVNCRQSYMFGGEGGRRNLTGENCRRKKDGGRRG